MDRIHPALQDMLWHIEQRLRSSYHWLRAGRWSVYLACLPLVVFAVAYALASPRSLKPKATPLPYVEQVAPKADFVQRFGAPQEPPVRVVKTIPITREPPVEPAPPAVIPERIVADQPVPTERQLRHRSIRRGGGDICSRHNMRKVVTRGGKSWRCRR